MKLHPVAAQHFAAHPLTDDHMRALRSVHHGHVISEHRAAALIEHGYAKQAVGGLMLTDLGKARLIADG